MKNTILLPCLLLSLSLQAQKKPLDHSVFDSWQAVSATAISPSGKVVSYEVNPQEGDGTLYIRVAGKKQDRVIEIPRGYRATVLEDDSYAVCQIKPYFARTRRAKIDKKKADDMPKDSLAIINLKTGEVRKFPDVKGYKAGKHALQAFAFATADTSFIPKADRKKKDMGGPLAVYHFADGSIDTLRNVTGYVFSEDGGKLGLVRQLGKKKMNAGFYSVASRSASFEPDTCTWLGLPVFDEAGEKALFLSAKDTLESGSKHASLHLWDGTSARLMEASLSALPQGWGITENSKASFSHDGSRIFVGVQAYVPPKDTTLVPFETPGLDIWNWDADELPPYQKTNLKRDETRTYTTELVNGTLVPFTLSKRDRLHLGNRGDAPVYMTVHIDNPVETQWNYQMSKTILVNGKEVFHGRSDGEALSPLAKYAIWWDYADLKWHILSVADMSVSTVEGTFYEEDDDHPMRPEPCGIVGWTEDEKYVLLYDKYDIWRVPTSSGQAGRMRLTSGRERRTVYRYIDTRDKEEERFIPSSFRVSVFDEVTKENGIASVTVAKPMTKFQLLDFGGYSWSSVKKAAKADVYLYQKGNFRDPMDLYWAVSGRAAKKLTAINPQIADYNWGTVELYHWTAFDGTRLDGLLYKPEDFDASKKYPVICYFYEKNSETLYNHIQVQPMWSIINIPFFVSRGYVVFVPDIVYHAGIPGECAYNCIVSGAQSLWQFPWIDRDNMAIQGQSWGGYQVAYLITRTGMFKAAGAGAPVSNMTSAYGGIRWESGVSRQGQYEMGQSRIGRELWDGIELYMENSPLFKLPNVTTPVLIMHNDNDGAVPWYQGIEMFMGLRRLGKPAWLLEYNDEAHNLRQRRNRKDLSIRLQQFFDYYLKGEPEPAWMRDGVPTAKKGYYFGYEY